jgi:cobalamin biosynthesis protein CobD/CbiB
MAALAGALNICLEKPGYYVLVEDGEEPEMADVPRALIHMQTAIALTLAAALLMLFYWPMVESWTIVFGGKTLI